MKIVRFENGRYALAKRMWFSNKLKYADLRDLKSNGSRLDWWTGDTTKCKYESDFDKFSTKDYSCLCEMIKHFNYGKRPSAKETAFITVMSDKVKFGKDTQYHLI